jgi:hypothetical protein
MPHPILHPEDLPTGLARHEFSEEYVWWLRPRSNGDRSVSGYATNRQSQVEILSNQEVSKQSTIAGVCIIVRLSACLSLPLLLLFLASGCASTTSLSGLRPLPSQIAYPDTDAGFQKFIGELGDAYAKGSNVQSRMHALLIPNSSSWFIEVFGPTNGPILDIQYRYQLGYQFARLSAYLPIYAGGQNRLIYTERSEPGHLSPFVTDSDLIPLAEQPLKIYSASIATNEEGPWLKVGSFVYIDGNFRELGALGIEVNWHSFYAGYDKPFEH